MQPNTNLLMLYKYKLRYIRYYACDRERGQTMKKLSKQNSSKIKDYNMLHHIGEKKFLSLLCHTPPVAEIRLFRQKSQVTQNICMDIYVR